MSETGESAGKKAGPRGFRRNDLVAAVAEKAGLPRPKAQAAVAAVITTMSKQLRQGEPVHLAGFGAFVISDRKAGKGRDPRTGAEIDIPATRSVRFRPGKELKTAVSGATQHEGAEHEGGEHHEHGEHGVSTEEHAA